MPASTSPPLLYHSSPDYPTLTGREVPRVGLLERIKDAWRAGHRILGLHGCTGIGKTLTALQAATSIHGETHGCTVWVELRVCPNAGGFLSQLADCLQDMGLSALAQPLRQQTRPAPESLAHSLAHALGQNTLLIVDQCETVLNDQGRINDPYLYELLNALLDQAGWRSLLVVRTEQGTTPPPDLLALPVRWFLVGPLSAQEQKALLQAALPTSPLRWHTLSADTQHLILHEMAGHPYAFTLFLADPGDDPAATLCGIQQHATGGLKALLEEAVGRVPATARPMLDLLVALEDREPWPFLEGAWKALGAILGWPARQAKAALTELTRRALVEQGSGGYRLLPMVREHVLSQPPPLGLSETLGRFLHYHLVRLYEALAKQVKEQAQGLLTSGGLSESDPQVLALIRYHAVLRDRALRQALRRNTLRLVRGTLEGLLEPTPWQSTLPLPASRCIAYAHRLAVLLEEVAAQPGSDQEPAEIGACYQAIGWAYDAMREEDQAIQAYQHALEWWEQTRQPHRIGSAWVAMGGIHARQQRWSEALLAYRTALDWSERTRQYPEMGNTWHQIGNLYAAQCQWSEALTAYHTALDWQGRTKRQRESGHTWQRIGEIHAAQQNIERAAYAYTQALESFPAHDANSRTRETVLASAQRLLEASPTQEETLERLRRLVDAL